MGYTASIVCVSSSDVNDISASRRYGTDKAIDDPDVDLAKDLRQGCLQSSRCSWLLRKIVQFPMNVIPQVFNGIDVRTLEGPWKDTNVVALEKGGSCCSRMRPSVVLLHAEQGGHFCVDGSRAQ